MRKRLERGMNPSFFMRLKILDTLDTMPFEEKLEFLGVVMIIRGTTLSNIWDWSE